MRLIGLAVILTVSLTLAPLAAEAQLAGKVYWVGYLGRFPPSGERPHPLTAFTDGLREHGYFEGKNLTLEYRYSHGRDERWPDLVRELVQLGVQVIATADSGATQAVKEHARTMPVVLLGVSHPIEAGFIVNLARPGGNITGLSNQLGDLEGKSLQLLREAAPKISRLAVFWNPANPGSAIALKTLQRIASDERLTVQPVTGRTRDEVDDAFATLRRERPDALLVNAWYGGSPQRARIVEFATTNRIPTVSGSATLTRDGLLMSYGPNFADLFRRGASYVDKILKGAKPADLPVEQPTKFEFVINLKTAKALGLTIPQSVLVRADQIIE